MNISYEDLDAFAEAQLESLRPVPPRRAERAAEGRAAFLNQARQLRQQAPIAAPPQSSQSKRSLGGWMAALQSLFQKNHPAVWKPVFALLVALALVFGSVVVSSAQNSLPGAPFYNIKLLTEDVRMDLASRPQSRLDLALAFSTRRVSEIVAQQQRGLAAGDKVAGRWQQELELGLQLAAGLPENELPAALQQIHLGLQQQERLLQQAGEQGVVARIRQQIQEYLRLVEAGQQNPAQFRRQWQAMQQRRQQPHQETLPTPAAPGPGSLSTSPQPGSSGTSQSKETPTPCSGCGPAKTGGHGTGQNQGQPQPGSGSGSGSSQPTPKPGKSTAPGQVNPGRPSAPPGQNRPKNTPEKGKGGANCTNDCPGSGNTNGSGHGNSPDFGGPGNGKGHGYGRVIGVKTVGR